MASWEDLIAEHRRESVGRLLAEEIRDVASRVARRYPPRVYAQTSEWDVDALDEVAQDVVASLLANGMQQLAYVMLSCSLSDFRGLVGKETRRVLSHRRQRTVIDNLLDRMRRLLAVEPYREVQKVGRRSAYAASADATFEDAAPEDIRLAAQRVAKIPKLPPPTTGDRAPVVFDAESLRLVLEEIACTLPHAFTEREIALVLEQALTGWIPIVLESDVDIDTPSPADWSELDIEDARRAVESALATIDSELVRAVTLRSSGLTQEEVAQALGCSRPTAINRINDGYSALRGAFGELSDEAQVIAADFFLARTKEWGQ